MPYDEDVRTGFRAGGSVTTSNANLGLLAEFQGNWRGHGLNITARPDFGSPLGFFLEVNGTHETLDFTAISGDIPNRGSLQADVLQHGVRYLQQVTDVVTDTGIHIEPGIWLHVPASTAPALGESYVRQSAIPHGDVLLAQTTFFSTLAGGPLINSVDTTPFSDPLTPGPGLNSAPTSPTPNADILAVYKTTPLPATSRFAGLDPVATIKDPTKLLSADIAGQNIISTIVLVISTANQTDPTLPGSLVNIPFVQKNANATLLDGIFWIETVQRADGSIFLQLQYVQRVILEFGGLKWPHISVATLRRL